MSKFYQITISVLMVMLLSAFAMSYYYYNRMAFSQGNVGDNIEINEEPPFRVSLILSNSENLYWKRFRTGAMDAAIVNNVALEFHSIDNVQSSTALGRQIRIAVASQKDAIILNTIDENAYESDMAYLVANDILVMTTGVEAGQNSYFVGTNTFEFGQRAAQLVIQAAGESARIAVILDSTTDEFIGFSKEIQNYENAVIETVKKTDGHLIGAVDVIHSILTDFPDVNVIFCMTSEDTLAAAQAIVDRNLVGEVIVVGSDLSDTPIVRRYIERNIIYGYIERNPYDAGFQSVAVISGVLRGEFKPTFVTIDLDTITKWDIGQYTR